MVFLDRKPLTLSCHSPVLTTSPPNSGSPSQSPFWFSYRQEEERKGSCSRQQYQHVTSRAQIYGWKYLSRHHHLGVKKEMEQTDHYVRFWWDNYILARSSIVWKKVSWDRTPSFPSIINYVHTQQGKVCLRVDSIVFCPFKMASIIHQVDKRQKP